MCNKKYAGENCIAEILCIINILQRNVCPDNRMDSCDKPTLGSENNNVIYNTRPVIIYTCINNGNPFSMITNKDSIVGETSTVFRVEKVEGNSCTFRVLIPNPDLKDERNRFIGTNSFFALNLDCVCAIRCLSDCFIECV